jgi:hypothetical protein
MASRGVPVHNASRSTPTVDVHIETRSALQDWCWQPWSTAAEFAYGRADLLRLTRVYGHWGSIMTGGAHLRVTIQGRYSGRYVVQHEWDRYAPVGEPWIHIPSWHSLSLAAQFVIPYYEDHDERRLIDTGQTDVRTLRLNPVVDDTLSAIPAQTPHVRHKEDVPHEHALPDLYGLSDGSVGRFSA